MKAIKGNYKNDDGTIGRRATLYVDIKDGLCQDQESGDYLTAAEYRITGDMKGIEIIADRGVAVFLPDEGECERVGLPVTRL